MMGVVRRAALAVLGVSFVLLSVVVRHRAIPLFIHLVRVYLAVLAAIWLRPLLLVALIRVKCRTGRSPLSYVAVSPDRRAAWFVAILV
jgi:hypothetical protein